MEAFFQGLILAFREGLEAFLMVAVLLKFLDRTDNENLKKNVWHGLFVGILVSFVAGIALLGLSSFIGAADAAANLWESGASLLAVLLIVTFIIWMINHGSQIKKHIENKAALNLSAKGIFLLSLFMVAREGVEIALFQFAGKYTLLPILLGLVLSIGLVVLIYYSLVRVKLQTIFNITLAYLILQAGFLMGYSVHEGLSAAKEVGALAADNPLFVKAFDVSGTALYHKEGIVGVPLYVAFGWYSKPEWIQFILQYGVALFLFLYWWRRSKKDTK